MPAELTAQERAEHIAEWIRITGAKEAKAQVAPSAKPHTGGRPDQGINAAVRELGIDRTEAQRAVKIASIAPEAKEAAAEAPSPKRRLPNSRRKLRRLFGEAFAKPKAIAA